jgi:hypothetical protein
MIGPCAHKDKLMLPVHDLRALTASATMFASDERGCFIRCALFDFDARSLMREFGSDPEHHEARRAIRHIQRDLWNAATLVARLEWLTAMAVAGELHTEAWRSFCSLDVTHYFIALRSAMDYSCHVIDDLAPRRGQLPKSFERLKQRLGALSSRMPPNIPDLIGNTHWFDELRAVRNALVHEGGNTLVFCEPQDGVAMFQIYNSDSEPLLSHEMLMYNEHVIRFDRFAAWSMAHFLTYLNTLGDLLSPPWDGDPRVGITQSYCFGFATLHRWLEELRIANSTAI